VFISGQTAWDVRKNIVGGESLLEQARQALRNVQAAIEAIGGTLRDVVALRIYIVNYQRQSGRLRSKRILFSGESAGKHLDRRLCIGRSRISNRDRSHGGLGLTLRAEQMMFAIKAEVADPQAETFAFNAQKTMYGGKHIAKGDTIFLFASENEGGPGLIASGVVTSAKPIAKKRGIARQTPRVSISIRRTALAKRRLGRSELKRFCDWTDGPETELNSPQLPPRRLIQIAA
jgi:enamine deaminase RidA (YjgF/YER057c/UK114 family)